MGACASVPKAMRGEATAPPPETPKEDTTTTVAPEVTTVEDKENVAADQSLGTLLVEGEGAKQEGTSESTKVDNEESKAEELPVSEPATSEAEPPVEKKAEAAQKK